MTYEQAAWSWTQHLRRGGSTPWQQWLREWQPDPDTRVPAGWTAPGAAQLELVRRLADRGGALRGFTGLADLVLGRSGPGRGLAEQPLSWRGEGAPRFGPPPVDPVDVPLDELVRLGVGVLAELLLRAPAPSAGRSSLRRWPLTRTPAFALDGAPVTTAAVRRALGGAGHAEGGRSPRVVLFAEPVDRALVQAWSVRVQEGSSTRWHGFVDRWAARRRLPPGVDVVGSAREWGDRVGPSGVHIVAAPRSFTEAASAVCDLLDLTPRPGTDIVPRWTDLEPEGVDVLRRLNGVLGVRAADEDRAGAVRAFVRLYAGAEATGHRLTVPDRHVAWARDAAERMAGELAADGYPVHGRLDELVPDAVGVASRPRRREVLKVVIWACLRQTMAMEDGADYDGAEHGKAAT